jgi:hypothetical protein
VFPGSIPFQQQEILMRQSELYEAVARATGESVETVQKIGFQEEGPKKSHRRLYWQYRRRHAMKRRLRASA